MRLCDLACLFQTYRIIVGDSAFGSFELSVALWSAGLYSVLCIKAKRYWPKWTNGKTFIEDIMKRSVGDVLAKIGTSKLVPKYRFVLAGLCSS